MVRAYLQQHPELAVRSADNQNPRPQNQLEPGSVKHISLWLDKNTGDVMRESKIANLL